MLVQVKARIQDAQFEALRAVNKEQVELYWDIGRLIVERQRLSGWGKSVVERLSTDLRTAFPGVRGFSAPNLWFMRQFFQTYSAAPILLPLVRELAWAHSLVIMTRCKDALEREFYLRAARKFGWSKNVLIHQIDNQSYLMALATNSSPFPLLIHRSCHRVRGYYLQPWRQAGAVRGRGKR